MEILIQIQHPPAHNNLHTINHRNQSFLQTNLLIMYISQIINIIHIQILIRKLQSLILILKIILIQMPINIIIIIII